MRSFAAALLAGMCVLALPGFTAPAMRGPACRVRGVIEDIRTRREYYTPESWRKSWGLPEFHEYTDVRVRLMAADLIEQGQTGEDCTGLASGVKVFQLRSSESRNVLSIGGCFEAQTRYSGDEFAIGQWLFDVRLLDAGGCAELGS